LTQETEKEMKSRQR